MDDSTERSESVLAQAEEYVREQLRSDSSGHDWWHIDRVRKLAVKMAKREQVDTYVCELAALLHDIADAKLNPSKEAGMRKVESWLKEHRVDREVAGHVLRIIATMSYNQGQNPPMDTLEGQIVQDADRLDAIGAIGIARTFAFAGWKGHLLFDPERSDDPAAKTAIGHFYEKLLKLRGLMNTAYGKELADQRHRYMEQYLRQFFEEWGLDGDAAQANSDDVDLD